MAFDQHAANLVTTTVNAFNGDTTSISSIDGLSLIDSWISALGTNDQDTDSVTDGLNELRTELKSSSPDGDRIQELLGNMADQARQMASSSADAEVKATLDPLVDALQGFRQQLGGSEKIAAMNIEPSDTVMPGESGGQAPMTSTVGGESTNSGAGASTLRDDDQLSNRNGGTMDSGSAPAVPATTGSAGAEQMDGGSYGSGYGTGSDGDTGSDNSGIQRSGVSGGTAESGSAASGGHS